MKNNKPIIKTVTFFGVILFLLQGVSFGENSTTAPSKKETQVTTETFKVYGNCGACKKRIEGGLKGVEGIQSADWNTKTKMMTIAYDKEVLPLDTIHQKIADVGHDTEKIMAKDSVYSSLMECCQFERRKVEKQKPMKNNVPK